jgi:natural product precursor
MKTLRKIKLNQFSKEELDQRKMNALRGGDECCCTCGCTCSCSCALDGLKVSLGTVNKDSIGNLNSSAQYLGSLDGNYSGPVSESGSGYY